MTIKTKILERTPRVVFRAVSKVTQPKVLFGGGALAVVTGGVLACRATLRLPEIMDNFEGEVERESSDADPKTMSYIYAKHGLIIAKNYAVPVGVTVVGFALMTTSHVKLTRQNEALVAAYSTLSAAFDSYRERVREELGEKKEAELYYAPTEVEQGIADAKALAGASPYSRWFDRSSDQWTEDPEYNKVWIQAQVEMFNRLLRVRGYVFLNEVYERLGLPVTKEGQVVGWYYEHGSTDFKSIDVGVYEHHNREFLNGKTPDILLDFNVHGVITDKI